MRNIRYSVVGCKVFSTANFVVISQVLQARLVLMAIPVVLEELVTMVGQVQLESQVPVAQVE